MIFLNRHFISFSMWGISKCMGEHGNIRTRKLTTRLPIVGVLIGACLLSACSSSKDPEPEPVVDLSLIHI